MGRSRVLILKLDLHARGVVIVRANWIRGTAVAGQIPVLLFIKAEGNAVVRVFQCVQYQHREIVEMDIGPACEVEIGREASARPEHHLPQHRAPFEGQVLGQTLFVKELEKESQDYIDFDVGDVPRTRTRRGLTKLVRGEH